MQKKVVGFIRKREETCIVLINTENITDELELKLYNVIKKASKDRILEGRELEKWCANRYNNVLNWFGKVNKIQEENLLQEEKIIKRKSRGHTKYYATDKLNEEAKQLAGLKKYLEDYTLIKERKAIEVELLEEYLIYAQIFGIAKEVVKEFKKLYPQIWEKCGYSYDDIIFIDTISHRGIRSAESARYKAYARASSYSSGGGGFSSGGGRRRVIWTVAVVVAGGFR